MKRDLLLTLCIFISALSFSQKYAVGHYYTYDGQRVDGLIMHVVTTRPSAKPDNSIYFKANEDDKRQELTTKEIKSFVIGTDSFIIIKDFAISGFAGYTEDFVKMVKSGKINLYLHHTAITGPYKAIGKSGPFTTYLVEKGGAIMRMSHKDFRGNLDDVFGDDKELRKKIKDKRLKHEHLEEIVEEYNNRAQQNIGKQ